MGLYLTQLMSYCGELQLTKIFILFIRFYFILLTSSSHTVSVDVVILSCLAGALRSYMKLCGVENPRDIRACLQVDVRPLHAGLKLDNQFTPVFVKLPVGTEG